MDALPNEKKGLISNKEFLWSVLNAKNKAPQEKKAQTEVTFGHSYLDWLNIDFFFKIFLQTSCILYDSHVRS